MPMPWKIDEWIAFRLIRLDSRKKCFSTRRIHTQSPNHKLAGLASARIDNYETFESLDSNYITINQVEMMHVADGRFMKGENMLHNRIINNETIINYSIENN